MPILGISSATKVISLGLIENNKVLAELSVSGKEASTEDLVLYIQKLVSESKARLKGISVAHGPGAYSGLRGGLAVAKTLAHSLKLPLASVSTLEALAYNLIGQTCSLVALTHARKNEYNLALFTVREKMLTRLTEDLVVDLERLAGLLDRVKGELHILGEVDDLKAALKDKTHLVFHFNSMVKGSAVAFLGSDLISRGRVADPLKLIPRYSHKPSFKEYK